MKRHNRILAVVLALIMILGTVPSFAANEVKEVIASKPTFADMPTEGHWSYAALKSAVDNGLMSGSNGLLNPSNNMTRAEMAGIINNAFGAIDEADITAFTDVAKTDWFYSVIAKAVQMKTFAGSGNGLMNPTASIPRQDALVVIAKVLQLQSEDYSVLEKFADKALIAEYAKPYLAALVKAGYVAGSDGKIEPAKLVTREEVAQLLYNVFKTIITKAGTVTGDMNGNVLVNVPDVVLKDSKITGDLIIADGVGNGDITLDNVEITGKLIVRGGGEHSIKIINNSNVGNVVITKNASGKLRVYTEKGARVDIVNVEDGSDQIVLEGSFINVAVNTDTPVVFVDADIARVAVNANEADVTLASGSITSVTVESTAKEASVVTKEDSKVASLEIDSSVKVTVGGSVSLITISETIEEIVPVITIEETANVNTIQADGNAEANISVANASSVSNLNLSGDAKIEIIASEEDKAALEKVTTVAGEPIVPSNQPAPIPGGSSSSSSGSTGGGTVNPDPTPAPSPSDDVVTPEVSTTASIKSLDELMAAIADEKIEKIIVDDEVTISDAFITIKNVFEVAKTGLLNLKNSGLWFSTGANLEVHGSVNGDGAQIILDGANGLNDGSIQLSGICTSANMSILNYGSNANLTIVGTLENKASFINDGTIRLTGSCENLILRGFVDGSATYVNGSTFVNNGDAVIGYSCITGLFENNGEINQKSTLNVRENGIFNNKGSFITRRDNYISVADNGQILNLPENTYVTVYRSDTYCSDGTVIYGGKAHVTGTSIVISSLTAEVYGERGLKALANSGISYESVYLYPAENESKILVDSEININASLVVNNVDVELCPSAQFVASSIDIYNSRVTVSENASLATTNLYISPSTSLLNNGKISLGQNGSYSNVNILGIVENSGVLEMNASGSIYVFRNGIFNNKGLVKRVDDSTTLDSFKYRITVSENGFVNNIPSSIEVTVRKDDHYYSDGFITLGATPNVTNSDNVINSYYAYVCGVKGYENFINSNVRYDWVNIYSDSFDSDVEILVDESLPAKSLSIDNVLLKVEDSSIIVDSININEGSSIIVNSSSCLNVNRVNVSRNAEIINNGTMIYAYATIDGKFENNGVIKHDTINNYYVNVNVSGLLDNKGSYIAGKDYYISVYDKGCIYNMAPDVTLTVNKQDKYYADGTVVCSGTPVVTGTSNIHKSFNAIVYGTTGLKKFAGSDNEYSSISLYAADGEPEIMVDSSLCVDAYLSVENADLIVTSSAILDVDEICLNKDTNIAINSNSTLIAKRISADSYNNSIDNHSVILNNGSLLVDENISLYNGSSFINNGKTIASGLQISNGVLIQSVNAILKLEDYLSLSGSTTTINSNYYKLGEYSEMKSGLYCNDINLYDYYYCDKPNRINSINISGDFYRSAHLDNMNLLQSVHESNIEYEHIYINQGSLIVKSGEVLSIPECVDVTFSYLKIENGGTFINENTPYTFIDDLIIDDGGVINNSGRIWITNSIDNKGIINNENGIFQVVTRYDYYDDNGNKSAPPLLNFGVYNSTNGLMPYTSVYTNVYSEPEFWEALEDPNVSIIDASVKNSPYAIVINNCEKTFSKPVEISGNVALHIVDGGKLYSNQLQMFNESSLEISADCQLIVNDLFLQISENSTAIIDGSIFIGSNGSVSIYGNQCFNGNINVSGHMNVSGSIDGNIVIDSNGCLDLYDYFELQGCLINNGNVFIYTEMDLMPEGTFTNNNKILNYGILKNQANSTFVNNGIMIGDGTFINNGKYIVPVKEVSTTEELMSKLAEGFSDIAIVKNIVATETDLYIGPNQTLTIQEGASLTANGVGVYGKIVVKGHLNTNWFDSYDNNGYQTIEIEDGATVKCGSTGFFGGTTLNVKGDLGCENIRFIDMYFDGGYLTSTVSGIDLRGSNVFLRARTDNYAQLKNILNGECRGFNNTIDYNQFIELAAQIVIPSGETLVVPSTVVINGYYYPIIIESDATLNNEGCINFTDGASVIVSEGATLVNSGVINQ